MAGGEGSRRRRTAKSVEDAATGSQAQLSKCSTKRKSGKEAASGWVPPRPRAVGRKETTSAVASACADTEKANRLSAKDIRWILAQKPQAPPPRYQALKRRNPELVPRPGEEEDKRLMSMYAVTRALFQMQERLPKLQEWVRSELKEKGYVEVDDEWFKLKAEAQASIDRQWPTLKAKIDELRLMDEPSLSEGGDERDSDPDEEDGEDEDDLESVMRDYM